MYNHVFLPSIFVCCICIFICSCGHFRISYNFPFNLSFISPMFQIYLFVFRFYLVGPCWLSGTVKHFYLFAPGGKHTQVHDLFIYFLFTTKVHVSSQKSELCSHLKTCFHSKICQMNLNPIQFPYMYFDVGPRGDKILED